MEIQKLDTKHQVQKELLNQVDKSLNEDQIQDQKELEQKKTIPYEETKISDDDVMDPALREQLKRIERFKKLSPKQLPVSSMDIDFGKELPSGQSWMYIKELPSNFLGYPPGVVILYQPYTFAELDTINDGKLSTAETLAFMSKGIFARGINIEDLYLGDVLYICLLRKLSSLGMDTFSVQYKHFEDGVETVYSKVFHLNEITFSNLKAPALPVSTKISGDHMEFEPLKLGKYLRLVNLGLVGKDTSDEKFHLLASCVTNMEYEDALLHIKTAVGADITRLTYIDACLSMGVEPVKFDYMHKGRRYDKRIDILNIDSLVTPFCLISESSGNPIRFGVHQDSECE